MCARRARCATSVGIVDVSTLGKIDVQGPDAATFLDRVYTNTFSTLAVGKARYGLMLREDGLLFDDGTTWRLGDNGYLMTTTTANAGKVMQHLGILLSTSSGRSSRCTSPRSPTNGRARRSRGPNSRALLAAALDGTAVDDAALPFMGSCTARSPAFR